MVAHTQALRDMRRGRERDRVAAAPLELGPGLRRRAAPLTLPTTMPRVSGARQTASAYMAPQDAAHKENLVTPSCWQQAARSAGQAATRRPGTKVEAP
jgi:hypothetical protein